MEETNNKWKKPLLIIGGVALLLGLVDLIYFGFIDKKPTTQMPLSQVPHEEDIGEIDVAEELKKETEVVEYEVPKEVIKEVPVEKVVVETVTKEVPVEKQIVVERQVPVPVIQVQTKTEYIPQEVVKEVEVEKVVTKTDPQIIENYEELLKTADLKYETYKATHNYLDMDVEDLQEELDSLKVDTEGWKSWKKVYEDYKDYDPSAWVSASENKELSNKCSKLEEELSSVKSEYSNYILETQDIESDYKATIEYLSDESSYSDVKTLVKQIINLQGKVRTLVEQYSECSTALKQAKKSEPYTGDLNPTLNGVKTGTQGWDLTDGTAEQWYQIGSEILEQYESTYNKLNSISQSTIAPLRQQLEEANSTISEYEETIAKQKTTISENEATIASLTNELGTANKVIEDAQPAIEFYSKNKDAISDLNSKLSAKDAEYKKLQDEYNELLDKYNDLVDNPNTPGIGDIKMYRPSNGMFEDYSSFVDHYIIITASGTYGYSPRANLSDPNDKIVEKIKEDHRDEKYVIGYSGKKYYWE